MKSIRFQRILAAIARSTEADYVFEQALNVARRDSASLVLAHCLSYESLPQFSEGPAGQPVPRSLSSEIEDVYEWLDIYGRQAKAQGIDTELVCQVGDIGFRLCQVAECWQTDLIVVGHGGIRTKPSRCFGLVTQHVLLYAPGSVMAVYQKAKEPTPQPEPTPATLELDAFQTQIALPFPRRDPFSARLSCCYGRSHPGAIALRSIAPYW